MKQFYTQDLDTAVSAFDAVVRVMREERGISMEKAVRILRAFLVDNAAKMRR